MIFNLKFCTNCAYCVFVAEKDLGFLRIGSLNVRVKRTTEAVSNFLGVSQTNLDKAHKTWGSADSIQVKLNCISCTYIKHIAVNFDDFI